MSTQNAAPTAEKIEITSLDRVRITMSDGATLEAGTVADAIANKLATPRQLHGALTEWHAAQLAAAKQSGSNAATEALEPGHAMLASLFARGSLTPDDLKAGAAVLADLRKTQRERALAKAQKAAADAQAALEALQARAV